MREDVMMKKKWKEQSGKKQLELYNEFSTFCRQSSGKTWRRKTLAEFSS